MNNSTKRFFLTLWMSFALMASNSFAQVTVDSTTWEGSYEANVLPSADGWTTWGNEASYASVSDGILTIDTQTG